MSELRTAIERLARQKNFVTVAGAMNTTHVINGFSDMKKQLISYCKLQKDSSEVELWFSGDDENVFVHDKYSPGSRMLVATKSTNGWIALFPKNSFSDRLVHYLVCEAIRLHESLVAICNERYRLYGFLQRRG